MDDLFDDKPIPKQDALLFLSALKVAAEMVPEPAVQSLYAASPEEIGMYVAQLITHEFKMHAWYAYYAEMLRGLDRGAAAETFEEIGPKEIEDAQYLLRRLNAISPKTPLPVIPSPQPLDNPAKIVEVMLVEEQRAVVLLTHLHQLIGDDPMKYQLEAMIAEEQTHADLLHQLRPAGSKLAAAVQALREAVPQNATQEKVRNPNGPHEATAQDGEAVAAAELQAVTQQALAENADLKQRLMETTVMAQQANDAAQNAIQGQQELQANLDQAQQAHLEAQDQASAAMEEAMAGQQAAAQESVAKMRLAIRIQQFRQQLADMVAQDPVQEEGAAAPPIMTATQQGAPVPGMEGEMDPTTGMPVEAAPASPALKAEKTPKAEKTAGMLPRAQELLSGSRVAGLRRGLKALEEGAHSFRAAGEQLAAHPNVSTQALGNLRGIAQRVEERIPAARAAARTEGLKVLGARASAGVATLGAGAAAHAGLAKKPANPTGGPNV